MANIGGAISGAASGASIGSSFGPWGTAAGGVIGGALGLFGGKKKKRKPISTLDPQQKQLYDQYFQGINNQGPLAGLYNYNADLENQTFDQVVGRPAYRAFNENIVPAVTGQFRSNNTMNSSYAGQALSRAGRDVQESLDAQRAAMASQQRNAIDNRRQSAIDKLLNFQSFAYDTSPDQPSTIDQILGAGAKYGGDWFADYLKNRNTMNQPAQNARIPYG